MKKPTVILFILFLQMSVFAKKHIALTIETEPFQAGERLEYAAYYNWGFLWLDAAKVDFKVRDTIIRKKPAYAFESTGISLKEYDWVFKVRDYYNSTAFKDELQSISFSRNTYEGGYKVDNSYLFDQTKNKVYMATENSEEPLTYDTLDITHGTFDLLTAIYYARTINYESLKEGDKIPIQVISDGEIFSLYFRYKGKERIETRETQERYDCAKFSVMLIEGTIFNEGEDMTIWITDDKVRIPVMVEAKILIGSVKAILTKASGTKFPIDGKLAELN